MVEPTPHLIVFHPSTHINPFVRPHQAVDETPSTPQQDRSPGRDLPATHAPSPSRSMTTSHRHHPHRHPRATRSDHSNSDESDDDNVCVAALRNKPPRHLSRSASQGASIARSRREPAPPPLPQPSLNPKDDSNQDQDDDLKAAVQCAWAVLEGRGDPPATTALPSQVNPPPQPQAHPHPQRQAPVPVKVNPSIHHLISYFFFHFTLIPIWLN